MSYSAKDAAELYELLNPWGPDDEFYLREAMQSSTVLDVGCGTGRLLQRARAAGHRGRLVGIDPDSAALDIARIECVEGTAASMTWNQEFELAIMMSHAFQFLVTDDDIAASLRAIRNALSEGGRFIFDTRNPALREWEQWEASGPTEIVDRAGKPLLVSYELLSVKADVVSVAEIISSPDGETLRVDRGSFRFLSADQVAAALASAGFTVEAQKGGWGDEHLEATSREIVTFARRP